MYLKPGAMSHLDMSGILGQVSIGVSVCVGFPKFVGVKVVSPGCPGGGHGKRLDVGTTFFQRGECVTLVRYTYIYPGLYMFIHVWG